MVSLNEDALSKHGKVHVTPVSVRQPWIPGHVTFWQAVHITDMTSSVYAVLTKHVYRFLSPVWADLRISYNVSVSSVKLHIHSHTYWAFVYIFTQSTSGIILSQWSVYLIHNCQVKALFMRFVPFGVQICEIKTLFIKVVPFVHEYPGHAWNGSLVNWWMIVSLSTEVRCLHWV